MAAAGLLSVDSTCACLWGAAARGSHPNTLAEGSCLAVSWRRQGAGSLNDGNNAHTFIILALWKLWCRCFFLRSWSGHPRVNIGVDIKSQLTGIRHLLLIAAVSYCGSGRCLAGQVQRSNSPFPD
ncbi:uncharacterized protein BDR25DRAFT_107369 [Lindgomyces ingoldianus]|uniref:Uncharacterized protein n=1 Tax=Lindgomyces ingoldianus TaxID=673940 RepID=A0ACB6Q9Q5_9PLEO|nr:uncharacterized protein BDR25DRAFT_107369 [Lindgomyces ingoldianus]KAF2463631.1 hypothetical protein BDR25DRAFT_107369 [Lindgomyces ingoldianus]